MSNDNMKKAREVQADMRQHRIDVLLCAQLRAMRTSEVTQYSQRFHRTFFEAEPEAKIGSMQYKIRWEKYFEHYKQGETK